MTDHKHSALARQLADSDLLPLLFAQQRADVIERWAAAESIDEREDAHATYCALTEIETNLAESLARITDE
jgi:hypothetical protein